MILFKNPQVGDKVILHRNGETSIQRIQKVGKKSIVVSSINLYRFNRDGKLNKGSNRDGRLDGYFIEPLVITPCGGCGESDPKQRCLGCFHKFTNDPNELKGYIGKNQVALGISKC